MAYEWVQDGNTDVWCLNEWHAKRKVVIYKTCSGEYITTNKTIGYEQHPQPGRCRTFPLNAPIQVLLGPWQIGQGDTLVNPAPVGGFPTAPGNLPPTPRTGWWGGNCHGWSLTPPPNPSAPTPDNPTAAEAGAVEEVVSGPCFEPIECGPNQTPPPGSIIMVYEMGPDKEGLPDASSAKGIHSARINADGTYSSKNGYLSDGAVTGSTTYEGAVGVYEDGVADKHKDGNGNPPLNSEGDPIVFSYTKCFAPSGLCE